MKGSLFFLCMVFLLKHKVAYASLWTEIQTQNVYLHGSTLESPKVNTLFECYTKCEDNIHCASINMYLANNTCELKHSTKTRHPHKKSSASNILYMEVRDALGSTPHNPMLSCKWFKTLDSHAKSGVYWMKFNEPSSAPFQVFCDMTTDGGGWTLVYSYTFTQFGVFNTGSTAVTPIPNWPVEKSSWSWVPQSIKTPLSESSHSAMDFSLWKKIGNEFLFKSNITNWVACVEGTGSLVNWLEGSLTCRVVKAITPTCTTVTPNELSMTKCGPGLFITTNTLIPRQYLTFDGCVDSDLPVHDPCGLSSVSNHLTNVNSPGGAIYFR